MFNQWTRGQAAPGCCPAAGDGICGGSTRL